MGELINATLAAADHAWMAIRHAAGRRSHQQPITQHEHYLLGKVINPTPWRLQSAHRLLTFLDVSGLRVDDLLAGRLVRGAWARLADEIADYPGAD